MSAGAAETYDHSEDWSVDTIFALSGDGVNGIFEASRTRQEQIRFIQVRHEEAAPLPVLATPGTPASSAFV